MSDSNATKNALAASMKKLMRQRPFEKISVSDICADCQINRKSFYYHFRDKYDLVNWIFYVGFVEELDMNTYTSGWEILEDICRYFFREKEFYRAALQIEGQNSLQDYIKEMVAPISEAFMGDIFKKSSNREFVIPFVSDALMDGLIRWLSGGYGRQMDADAFVRNLRQTILAIASAIPEED